MVDVKVYGITEGGIMRLGFTNICSGLLATQSETIGDAYVY